MLFTWSNMKYVIHACNKRMWYVEEFLYPSLIKRGIPKENIEINEDTTLAGCLFSTLESFRKNSKYKGGTWYIQDDVAICHDFYKLTKEHDEGVVCGFWHHHYEEGDLNPGKTPVMKMGYSFPCIRIPNDIAGEFVQWFYEDAYFREEYKSWIEQKKHVDSFFRDFMHERYKEDYVYNLKPSIVEHVDWLIGGSTINKWRPWICRATYWKDKDIIEELQAKLEQRDNG